MRLRAAGVPVGVSAAGDFARALSLSGDRAVAENGVRTWLYWTARVTLVDDQRHLAVFDQVFAAVFDQAAVAFTPARRSAAADTPDDAVNAPLPTEEGSDEGGSGLPWATLPRITGTAAETEGLPVPERLPNREPGLTDVPFEDLNPAELRHLERVLREAMRNWPSRRTRRERPRRRGARVAMRRTVARSRRTGWETIALERQGPVAEDRRLVMVCDVSQSMQPYATAYLHFMRAATRATGGETFAFATSLTRLTPVLGQVSPEEAIAQASLKVSDRFGGTRIATSLRALLRSHHGNTLRGAVCIIASDGWDSDPPEELAAQMARLSRRAHRTIWLNPRAAEEGFEPLVAGMAAALPYCDEFLPAHTIAGLAEVFDAIVSPSRRVSATARHRAPRPDDGFGGRNGGVPERPDLGSWHV